MPCVPLQQAEQEISSDWTLLKQGLPNVPSWTEYLSTASHSSKLFPSNSRLGLDPNLLSITEYNSLLPALKQRGIALVPIEDNLIDKVWRRDQPPRPKEEVFILDVKYAGEKSLEKVQRVRQELRKDDLFKTDSKNVGKKCWGMIISQLDEIACESLSIRSPSTLGRVAADMDSTRATQLARERHRVQPRLLFLLGAASFAVVETDPLYRSRSSAAKGLRVSRDPESVDRTVRRLERILPRPPGQIVFRSASALFPFCAMASLLGLIFVTDAGQQERVLLPPKTSLATALALSLESTSVIPSHLSPITALKAIKNATELEGFRECHKRDGVALVRYFNWLEKRLGDGIELKEFDAALKLEEFRSCVAFVLTVCQRQFPDGTLDVPQSTAIVQRSEFHDDLVDWTQRGDHSLLAVEDRVKHHRQEPNLSVRLWRAVLRRDDRVSESR